MNTPLLGPGDRYRLVVEALASQDGRHFTRAVAEAGVPLRGGGGGTATGGAHQAPGVPPSSYLVVVDEFCSLIIQPGENGISLRDIRLLNACHLRLSLRVMPGASAPDWLDGESTYLLFDGDHKEAVAQPARYLPFDGLVSPDAWPQADFAPLDVLAVAIGRSVERANTVLACTPSLAGTALVTGVKIRVGLSRVELGRRRVLLTLARPEEGAVEEFVELTLQTNFAVAEDELGEEEEIGPELIGEENGAT